MIAIVVIGCFFLSGSLAVVRLLIGPDLADRVAALDVALMSLMGAIAVQATVTGDTSFISLLAVIAIVGFTATVAASQFIEHGGGRADAEPTVDGTDPSAPHGPGGRR